MTGTLAERFEAKVNRRPGYGPNGSCHPWSGARTGGGYGHIHESGKKVKAHRVAWALANGPIPAGLRVLHRCDNPRCVNVEHLFLGTQADNMADMIAKGRGTLGSDNSQSKLEEIDILGIRQMLVMGVTHKEIGRCYGVHRATISKINVGIRWGHV